MKADKTIKNQIEETRQQKIIATAKFFFTQKAYSTYKTWDVQQYNDNNPSLVNYYFHNKERMFNKVIFRNVMILFNTLNPVLNDRKRQLPKKLSI